MSFEQVEHTHPRLKGFEAFYARELEPFLVEQEALRVAAQSKLKLYSLISLPSAAFGLGLVYLLGGFDGGWIGWVVAAVIVIVTLGVLAYATAGVAEVKKHVKEELMTRVCGFLGFTFNAEPLSAQLEWFRSIGLVPSYDRKSLEDEIDGSHDDVHFTLCEAHLEERRTRRDSDGRTETYYVTVFRGLLARFTFPKPFNTRTVLHRDGGMIGNFFGGIGKGGQRVRLEDPRFEKMFEVFSDDQIEARYLLTPTFMERVVELADIVGGRLQLAFDSNQLLLTVGGGKDRFESGSMFSRVDDPEMVAKIVREIGIVFQIVESLRLNLKTRI